MPMGTSGPFGNDTPGRWVSWHEMARRWRDFCELWLRREADPISVWFDFHAAREEGDLANRMVRYRSRVAPRTFRTDGLPALPPRSPFDRKVMLAAAVLGLAETIEPVPTDTTNTADPVLSDNPLGKVPVLIPGCGVPIYDCRVVVEYVDLQAGERQTQPRSAGAPTPRRCRTPPPRAPSRRRLAQGGSRDRDYLASPC